MANWDVLHVKTLQIEQGISESGVYSMLQEGELDQEDCLRRSGEERWWRVHEVHEFQSAPRSQLQPESAASIARPVSRTAATVTAPDGSLQASDTPLLLPFRRRRETESEELDMAPAATLAFLLILFFIVVSTVVLQKAIEFPKPSSEESSSPPALKKLDDWQIDHIIVRIRGDNTILVDDEPVEEAVLADRLAELRRQRAVAELIVRAADQAHHQTLVAVVNAANQARILKIKLASPVQDGLSNATGRPLPKRGSDGTTGNP